MMAFTKLLYLLLIHCPLIPLTRSEWVKRYREFDFNSTRTSYESLRIAPIKDRFIVKNIKHSDSTSYKSSNGETINYNKDQYVAVTGDQLLAVNGELVTTMTIREILRQSSGRFILPLVQRPDVNDLNDGNSNEDGGYEVLKWLKLEIVEAETISYRPQLAARQAKMRRANYETNEKKEMEKSLEEATKSAQKKKVIALEEAEKSVERRQREEEESKHKQKMLQAAKEMDMKQKALENAEKQRTENGHKREQARKHTQQKGIAENQKKTIELAKAAAQASAHANQAQRNLQKEDFTKLQEQTTAALKEKNKAEVHKVRERVANENAQHRKASEEMKKERDHQAQLAKGDEEARKQLVESIRSEQEAKRLAIIQTENAEAEEEKKRNENPYTVIDVKFRHKGPLGLFFVPGQMPMTIAKNGKDPPPFNLKENDELIKINQEDVLELSSPDEIVEVLVEASWPKTLTFRRLKSSNVGDNADNDHPGTKGSAVAITIVKPDIFSGWKMDFELAHFGEQIAKFCSGKEVIVAQPEDACKPLQGQHYDGKFVLVIRGGCMFSLKANNLASKNALGMIVINTNNDLVRMPTSPKDKVLLHGPSMLIKKQDGYLMQSILKVIKETDQLLLIRLAGGGTGCNMLVGNEKYRRKHKGQEDGFLNVWAGTDQILSFEMKKATFGGQLNNAPVRAIIADPITGCDEKGFSVNVRNALVFVIRGGCSFEEKARRIQQIGGMAVAVINTRGKISAMTPGEGGAKDITIPVVMIDKGSLEILRELVDTSSARELLSRMTIKDL